jgi:hydrophobe/amphiphile efflux-1 (HAE1) family protein
LFGLILAIGLVVDDAIVVVENIDRLVRQHGLRGRAAARAAMKEVTGPIIATSVVLAVVFIPAAFVPGVSGQLYRQFALTIAAAVALSTFNALTLSPALSALMLRRPGKMLAPLAMFSRWLERRKSGYRRALNKLVRRWVAGLVALAALLGATWWLANLVPRSFVPDEDQGYFIVAGRLPEAASVERADAVAQQVEQVIAEVEGVAHYVAIGGFDIRGGGGGSNVFTIFVALEPWDVRAEADRALETVLSDVRPQLARIQSAEVFAFNPPPIRGLGATGGFEFELLDRSGGDYATFLDQTRSFVATLNEQPSVAGANTSSSGIVPQVRVQVDRTKAANLDVPVQSIFEALQSTFGSFYVNDFNLFGRVYRVLVEARPEARGEAEDIGSLHVKSRDGDLVRLDNLVTVERDHGPQAIEHFNLFRSTSTSGRTAPGFSSAQALDTVEAVLRESMPPTIDGAWSGLAYEEREASAYTTYIFGLGILITFLVLAALYESWSLPVTIMFAVPPAILGALGLMLLRGLDNNIYSQVGLLMLIGLASKNSILVVEFARSLTEQGRSLVDAAVEAASVRMRPILMTAISFIVGVLPLAFASGAGAASRVSLGTAVLGGMILTTFISLFLVPILFVLVGRLAHLDRPSRHDDGHPHEVDDTMPNKVQPTGSGPR